MGWEAGLAIDVMLLAMVLGIIAIPIGVVYLLVRAVRRATRHAPQPTPLEDLRSWAEHEGEVTATHETRAGDDVPDG